MARLLDLETVEVPLGLNLIVVVVAYMTEEETRLVHMPLWRAQELGLFEAMQDGRFIPISDFEDSSN
ncbi:hypothetical protein [Roseomonas populi]|uniref:Uncharacterized protein n=1 Tax=Roseomonas populi TaxID=3121582 RepID=A0ABT1XCV3_9PROT|nr:hypothetical protein [Roseomonas pecuniae]MCR0985263.1 hypothetical protein [Roseomonas pecuniae]